MAEAAELRPQDRALEPSAGLGVLVALANARCPGMRWHINEIEPVRHEILKTVFPQATHTSVDAANLKEELDEGAQFDIVVMNPPFSARANGKRKGGEDIRHLASGLSVTRQRGRVVALTGQQAHPGHSAWDSEVTQRHNATLVWSKKLNKKLWKKRKVTVETRVSVVERESAHENCGWTEERDETANEASELVGFALTDLASRSDD